MALLRPGKFDSKRNATSLGARCRWGMRNGLFYVAKEEGSDKVLGVAMWLRPRPAGGRRWADVWESWRLWANQVVINCWYGRGGLRVNVSFTWLYSCISRLAGPEVSGGRTGLSRVWSPAEGVSLAVTEPEFLIWSDLPRRNRPYQSVVEGEC